VLPTLKYRFGAYFSHRCLTALLKGNNMNQISVSSELCDPIILPNLRIVSHSHLLREALIQVVQDCFQTDKPIQEWVLLDYGIGHDTAISSLQDLRSHYPDYFLLVVELKKDPALILDCIAAGAHAYVLQGASGSEIIGIMEQVDRGQFHCPPDITAKLFERLAQAQAPSAAQQPSLTQRELEVLHYIVQGYADRAIAAELVITVRTVKHHVHNLLGKLNLQSRWQAAQLAINNGWVAEGRSILDRSKSGSYPG
jgi:DNA-binding NarL/FixJ family response regulator